MSDTLYNSNAMSERQPSHHKQGWRFWLTHGLIALGLVLVHPADGTTIHQLLNHTSGLPDYAENIGFQLRMLLNPTQMWQPEEVLAYAKDQDLNDHAASQYNYANSNFVTLALIIEAAGKNSFGTLLGERILLPTADLPAVLDEPQEVLLEP